MRQKNTAIGLIDDAVAVQIGCTTGTCAPVEFKNLFIDFIHDAEAIAVHAPEAEVKNQPVTLTTWLLNGETVGLTFGATKARLLLPSIRVP